MGLSLVNNTTSLAAQNSLNRTNSSLGKSLEKLSSGLKVNRGADGPAALVISEQQRAQISGLRAAVENTSKAVALVQTGEGALNEINGLLTKIRSLSVDSANSGVNDSNALAANQAEIQNAIDTIDRISSNTQFGTKKLFDGTAGFFGSVSDTDITFLKADGSATAGVYNVAVTQTAQRGTLGGAAGNAITALGQDETLVVNGVSVSLASGDNLTAVINKINNFTSQTGVTALSDGGNLRLRTSAFGSAASISVQSNVAAAAGTTTGFGTTQQIDAGRDIQGTIGGVSGIGTGNVLTASGISLSAGLDSADTSQTNTVTGAQGTVSISDQRLTFQVGANAGQTVKVAFDKLTAASLGVGANGAGTANLASIDVRSASGAQDAIRVVDQAISDVTNLRGRLGAFQQNTLESNANNLRTTIENTTAAESTIRDTDYAQEIANFTKFQTQLQAGTTVLGNANQLTQLVAGLLRG